MKTTELQLHTQICEYVRLQYPKAVFNSDLAGSMKLSINQAKTISKLRSGRGFPDLVIYERRGKWSGLFLELKREGTKLFNSRGEYANQHLIEQAEMLQLLRHRGFMCWFAIGFDDAKQKIDIYLGDILEGINF